MLLSIEAPVYCCLFHLHKGGIVDGFARCNRTNVGQGLAGVVWTMEWHHCVEGVEFPIHHHSFPAMLEALGTWEALEGTLNVTAQILNVFEIRVQF